jgi:hypothetical protein
MLLYHPAFDIHHCVFRILQLLHNLKTRQYPIEGIQILDFYLLFPQEISKIALTRSLLRYRRVFGSNPNKYAIVPDVYRLFLRMQPYQTQAFACLASYDFISANSFLKGTIELGSRKIPTELEAVLLDADQKCKEVIDFLTNNLIEIPMYGPHGLKARTDLFEYRYDSPHSNIDD